MAANRILKLLIISNFLILLTQAYEPKVHRALPKNTVLKDCIGLSMDGSFSERYELILPVRSHIVIFRSSLESKFKITRAITKCTKHGSTSLVLPRKPFKEDLTICADISPNPGPVKSNDSVSNVTSNQRLQQPTTSNSYIALTHVYKPSFLRSFRFSPMSKHIDHKIYNYIRTLGILKPFRGRRSGRKVKIRNMTRNYIHVHGHNNKREISISSHHINSVPNTCNFFPIPAGETSTDSRLLKETPSKEFVPSLMLTNVMSLAPKIDEVSLFLLNKNPAM